MGDIGSLKAAVIMVLLVATPTALLTGATAVTVGATGITGTTGTIGTAVTVGTTTGATPLLPLPRIGDCPSLRCRIRPLTCSTVVPCTTAELWNPNLHCAFSSPCLFDPENHRRRRPTAYGSSKFPLCDIASSAEFQPREYCFWLRTNLCGNEPYKRNLYC